MKEVASLAARNRVRISTLDGRGLGRDLRQQNLLGESPFVGNTDFATNLGFDENADVLTTLALDTGGQRVKDRNDLRPALDAIATESGTYYMIGYSPKEPFDGSYRAIEVRTSRPGLTIRARRGYLAAKIPGQPSAPEPLPASSGKPESASAAARAATSAPPLPGSVVTAANATAGETTPPSRKLDAATPAPPAGAGADASATSGLRLRPDGAANVATLSARADAKPAVSEGVTRLAREGWDLYAAGKVEAARDRLAEASSAGAGVWVDYALGLAEFALDHFQAAVAAWERVRKNKPDFEPVYFDLADGYRRLERSDDSLAVLRDAAGRWPADAETHNAVGVVLVGRRALDDAIDAFNKADISGAERLAVGYFNLGRTYHLRYITMLKAIGQQTEAARSSPIAIASAPSRRTRNTSRSTGRSPTRPVRPSAI